MGRRDRGADAMPVKPARMERRLAVLPDGGRLRGAP